MDLDARPLRSFIAVAETNSFSRAAQKMNVSQPALSATISELERRLGFTLFDRTRRHVSLTAEGRLFLGNARRYVRENDILRQSWQEIRSNDLLIGSAFQTAPIPERNALIERFLTDHGDTGLQIHNEAQDRALSRLARGEIDLLIAIEPDRPPQDVLITSERGEHRTPIERIILSSRAIGLLHPREIPLPADDALTIAAWAGLPVVVPGRLDGIAVAEQVRFALASAGAETLRAPEGSARGVERYGALRRLPAVTFGWVDHETHRDNMQYYPLPELGQTHLSLIRVAGEARPAAALFWDHAISCLAN